MRQGKAVYSQDIFNDKIIEFTPRLRDDFFLYHPSHYQTGRSPF